MLKAGDVLGGIYEITENIGSGGGGIIFKANHLRMQKPVALKLIKDNIKGIIENRAEVDILKNLKNDHLPQVLDFVEDNGDVYTVMEFIEGSDMKKLIVSGKQFDEKSAAKYAVQLCSAVEYLHSQTPPIIHSDIKPANIMLTTDDKICLIDFNISSVSDGNGAYSVGGSKGFAAPEQFRKIIDVPVTVDEFHEETRFVGQDDDETELLEETAADNSSNFTAGTVKTKNISKAYVDVRTDIYGIGASLYYILTGRVPQNGQLDFRGTKVSLQFRKIIAKAMDPVPGKRYKNVSEMLSAIKRMSSGAVKIAAGIGAAAAVIAICAAVVFSGRSDAGPDITDGPEAAPAAVSDDVTDSNQEGSADNDDYDEIFVAFGGKDMVSVTEELDYYSLAKLNGDLSLLTEFTSLKKIDLSFRAASEIDISAFPELPGLEEISFSYSDITGLEGIAEKFPNLISLDISSTGVEDLSPVSGLAGLEYLDMSYIAAEDLSPLAGLKNLNYLNMHANELDPVVRDFSPISGLDAMETLILWSDVFTDNSFITDISKMEKLRSLHLGNVRYLDPDKGTVAIDDISGFENLTNLEELDISGTDVTSLAPLSGAVKMKELDISYCTDLADISAIAGMKDLEKLRMHITSDTSSGIAPALANLKNMKTLNLEVYQESHDYNYGYIYVDTYELLKSISGMKQLEFLDLYYISFSDDDIDTICNMKNLGYLTIKSDISAKNIQKLKDSMPDCYVDVTYKEFDLLEAPSPAKAAARTFAGLVYKELINNKTAAEPTNFSPVSLDHEGMSWDSDIVLVDIDFDGMPELCTGGHGVNNGSYTIYGSDGTNYGTANFFPGEFRIVYYEVYASGGSAMYFSYTKLCEGMPSVSIGYSGMDGESPLYDVAVYYMPGEYLEYEDLPEDEMQTRFHEAFGIDYDELTDAEYADFLCSELRVPDPENYTEEDIYDCIVKILLQYEEKFGIG